MPINEFEKLPEETKKEVLLRWDKKGFMPKQIKPILGKSTWKYSYYRKEFGLAKSTRLMETINDVKTNVTQMPLPPTIKEKPLPFTIQINKDYSGADISKKLLNLAAYFEKEENKFKVEIKIMEIENNQEG